MDYDFSGQRLGIKERAFQRFFEMLPGVTNWGILLGMIIFSFLKPLSAAVIIIMFDLYWLLRLLYTDIFLILCHSRLRVEAKTAWLKRARGLNNIYAYWRHLNKLEADLRGKKDFSLMIHRQEIRILERSRQAIPLLENIYHLVIIPIIDEAPQLSEVTIESLIEGNFPSERILIVLAIPESISSALKQNFERQSQKYKEKFFDLFVVFYPQGSEESKLFKGASLSYAAQEAVRYFKAKEISLGNVIVSNFDAGVVVNPDYFTCLTYRYMVSPDRSRVCFQPILAYSNNIWQISALKRVLNAGASFFQIAEATNPDNLVSFSSQSLSLKTLVEVGYWPLDTISAPAAIFWKAFIHFDGDYRLVPLYIKSDMDITDAGSCLETVTRLYKKRQFWAWGVENFPIIMRAFLKSRRIPFIKKLKQGFKLFEEQVSAATWPFLIAIISWLPALLAGREFSQANIYYSAPRITVIIISLIVLNFILGIILTRSVLPKKRERLGFFGQIAHDLGLILIPAISIFLGALPILIVQTRLMFSKYPQSRQ